MKSTSRCCAVVGTAIGLLACGDMESAQSDGLGKNASGGTLGAATSSASPPLILGAGVASGSSSSLPQASSGSQAGDGAGASGGADDFVLVKIRYKTHDAIETTPALETSAGMPVALLTDSLSGADADL